MSKHTPSSWTVNYLLALLFLLALFAVGVLAKVGYIVFVRADYWRVVSEKVKSRTLVLPAQRGSIISSDGKLMSSSLPKYKLYMDFKSPGGKHKDSLLMKNLDSISAGLSTIFPDKKPSFFKQRILEGRKKKSAYWAIYPRYASHLQYLAFKQLPVINKGRNFAGYIAEEYNQRTRLFGSLAARTLGDMYADKEKGAKNGLELAYNKELSGQNGMAHTEKSGKTMMTIVDKAPVNGYDIITTINVDYQDIAEKALRDKLKELEAEWGVVVLMDVKTGDVLANVNLGKTPSGGYLEDVNRSVSAMLEVGSTFKTATVLLGLDDGFIKPTDVFETGNGAWAVGNRVMKDHDYGKPQHVVSPTVKQILERSSNIGVAKIAVTHYGSNPQKFTDGLKRIGMGVPVELNIPGEAKPIIRGPKENPRFSKIVDLAWMAMGYGTQIPPIYLTAFYNGIANGGKLMKPQFVKAIMNEGDTIQSFPPQAVIERMASEQAIKDIQMILAGVVQGPLGKPARSTQFHSSGKTGTAQVTGGGAYGAGHLVSFCGYYPSEAPQFTCYVAIRIRKGLPSGGLMAGPVFRNISERVMASQQKGRAQLPKDSLSEVIPQVLAGNAAEATMLLDALHIPNNGAQVNPNKETIWTKSTSHASSVELGGASKVKPEITPNVIGMGAKDAVYCLQLAGLKVRIVGVGKVTEQSIAPNTKIKKGQSITITLK